MVGAVRVASSCRRERGLGKPLMVCCPFSELWMTLTVSVGVEAVAKQISSL